MHSVGPSLALGRQCWQRAAFVFLAYKLSLKSRQHPPHIYSLSKVDCVEMRAHGVPAVAKAEKGVTCPPGSAAPKVAIPCVTMDIATTDGAAAAPAAMVAPAPNAGGWGVGGMRVVYCEATGGLGNQLFLAAAALAYARRTGREVRFRRTWPNPPRAPTAQENAMRYLFPQAAAGGTIQLMPGPGGSVMWPPSAQPGGSMAGAGPGWAVAPLAAPVAPPRGTFWHTIFIGLRQVGEAEWESAEKNLRSVEDFEAGYREIKPHPDLPSLLLKGYYQSPRYFNLAALRAQLFPASLWSYAYDLVREATSGVAVAFMHFRRGDYRNTPSVHNILSVGWYERASEEFKATVPFLIFAEPDEEKGVRADLAASRTLSKRVFYWVDHRIPDYLQLLMMAQCQLGGIVANSSFSAWAAYLLQPTATPIVAPTKWFANKSLALAADLALPSWTRIDN